MKPVELTGNNFFWASLDNEVGTPVGRVPMQASLMAIDRQLQYFDDSAAVLRRAGYPRNDVAIDREAFVKSIGAKANDPKELRRLSDEYFSHLVGLFRQLEPTDDYFHWNDIVINKTQGDNSRTIDQRAHTEALDPQVMNGLGIMSLLLNRTTGSTETWGTVQYKIVVDYINNNIHRTIKRLSESIISFWLRVVGVQGTVKFVPNPVDYEALKTKLETEEMKQRLERRNYEYGLKSRPQYAKDAIGIDEKDLPTDPPDGRVEYIKKDLGATTAADGGDKQEQEETEEDEV
jgi:hypothetical protein